MLYYPEDGIEDSPAGVLSAIKDWRLANGKPGFKTTTKKAQCELKLKNTLSEYTESEYIELINRLFEGNYSSEREHDAIVDNIVDTSEHPNNTNILYYPEEGVEDSPEGVLGAIKAWRAANGKPGFKTEE